MTRRRAVGAIGAIAVGCVAGWLITAAALFLTLSWIGVGD